MCVRDGGAGGGEGVVVKRHMGAAVTRACPNLHRRDRVGKPRARRHSAHGWVARHPGHTARGTLSKVGPSPARGRALPDRHRAGTTRARARAGPADRPCWLFRSARLLGPRPPLDSPTSLGTSALAKSASRASMLALVPFWCIQVRVGRGGDEEIGESARGRRAAQTPRQCRACRRHKKHKRTAFQLPPTMNLRAMAGGAVGLAASGMWVCERGGRTAAPLSRSLSCLFLLSWPARPLARVGGRAGAPRLSAPSVSLDLAHHSSSRPITITPPTPLSLFI